MVDLDKTGLLPPGEHPMTIDEVNELFGQSMRRRDLMRDLRTVLAMLRNHGVDKVWLDGSFVASETRRPNDVDVVFEPPAHCDYSTWGVLAPSAANRKVIKTKYEIDLWPSDARTSGQDMVTFFSTDRDDNERGLVVLDLGEFDDQE